MPRHLTSDAHESSSTPVDSVRDYWARIIGEPRVFSMNTMLEDWERSCRVSLDRQETPEPHEHSLAGGIAADWHIVCRKARPWKAAGPDGIHNFWWKVLGVANAALYSVLVALDKDGAPELPRWLTRGRAVSLYKGSGDRKDPGNYRTIACLNTCYKLLTGVVTRWVHREAVKANALPWNQMALRRDVWSCTHAHVLDRTVVKDVVSRGRPLSIAWIDFAKAFDSVPHVYLQWVLAAIGLKSSVRSLLAKLMANWQLTFEGFENGKLVRSAPLVVRNGVLQGDTLSPLLFCLAVSPISHYLNNNLEEFVTSHGTIRGVGRERALRLNHIYYVDDLVVYCRRRSALVVAIDAVEQLSRDIGLTVNRRKSAFYHIGSPGESSDDPGQIPSLALDQSYKYLGVEKSGVVDHASAWKRIRESILSRTRVIWESELTFRQKVVAFNCVCVPKAKYLYANEIVGRGKLSSLLKEAKGLDREIRALLVTVHARHAHCTVSRLYMSTLMGGLGLRSFEFAVRESIVYTYCYLVSNEELRPCLSLFESLDRRNKRTILSDFRTVVADTVSVVIRDNLTIVVDGVEFTRPTPAARAITKSLVSARESALRRDFTSCEVASLRFWDTDIDFTRSYLWLARGFVSSTIVNNAIAAQEGQLYLKSHPAHQGLDKTCRLQCSSLPADRRRETAEHILTICPYWRVTLMVERHNRVAANLYNALCRNLGFETRHYRQRIEGYRKSGQYEIYWDHPIITTRKLRHNRPDIVVIDNGAKKVTIVEVSVSWFSHLVRQERRKYAKYAINSMLPEDQELNSEGTFPNGENLATELGRDLGYVVTVIPIVIGALGEVTRNTLQYFSQLGLPDSEVEDLMERCERSAVIGSGVIIKAHFSVPENRSASTQ